MIYMAFGFIIGVGFSFVAITGFNLASVSSGDMPSWMAPVFGVGAIVFLPVSYGIIGFVGGLLGAWVFNKAATAMGGLELVVE
jgi:uncharacterized oligopeptide transporter (OPT) family protein